MNSKTTIALDRFKRSFSEVADMFGINGNTLFTVMLVFAVRGMGDWTGAMVIQVIQLLKQGKDSGSVIEDIMIQRYGTGLN
ncbi:MAG: hypothetical protein PHN75_20530 [Syntrophales bacterium]|nr:hypothetical protein [Syntrophales bacterium]